MANDKDGEEAESPSMEKVFDRLTRTIEMVIRYLMTGIVVGCAIWVSCAKPDPFLCWVEEKPQEADAAALAIGFMAFIVYRLIFWTVLDGIFWMAGRSAPSGYQRYSSQTCGYDLPYANFLLWRFSKALPRSLSGYLSYRWSVVHFVIVSALIMLIASFRRADESLVSPYVPCVKLAVAIILPLALWQVDFLMRAERELCRLTKKSVVAPESETGG